MKLFQSLNYCLMTPESVIRRYLRTHQQIDVSRRYVFISAQRREAPMGVVHLDVVDGDHNLWVKYFQTLVISRALDDRLGLWMLMKLRETHDFHLLLTTDEERGRTSAADFVRDWQTDPSLQSLCAPNWLFQCDRSRTRQKEFIPTAVLYQYDSPALRRRLGEYGVQVELGTYSDIAVMTGMKAPGVNFSAAYQNAHTDLCRADLREVSIMLKLIDRFLAKEAGRKLV